MQKNDTSISFLYKTGEQNHNTGNVCTYNVIWSRVPATIVAVDKK
jgi:hypothetical protein